MMTLNTRTWFFVGSLILLLTAATRDPHLPNCTYRPTYLQRPWADPSVWCVEEVVGEENAGPLAFTALAAAPGGVLYAARPYAGEVLALRDTDGDLLPDTPQVVASGLTLPNALAYHRGALYIAGGAHIYRLRGDQIEVLVDDLPSGVGFWTGGLAIGTDEYLYVATGAPCDACLPADPERGAILRFDLDGGSRQIVATGLRHPAALAFHAGALWTVDSARDALPRGGALDELNQVTPGAFFGAPFCTGQANQPDSDYPGADCSEVTPPALAFPTHSIPLALASYPQADIPTLDGKLLVVLSGAPNDPMLSGFRVAAVGFDEAGQPTGYTDLVPTTQIFGGSRRWLDLNYSLYGFWPHRPLGLTVSAEGWIFISLTSGHILALRHR